jgi:hypothetical protein
MFRIVFLFLLSYFATCQNIPQTGKTLVERFQTPEGYIRVAIAKGSFGEYLRNFPLKPAQAKVYLHTGKLKANQDLHIAVLDIDTGSQDLQQCADAVMRLRAEYLFDSKQMDKIGFKNFAGTNMDWQRYAQGYRITAKGAYQKVAKADNTKQNFRKYLDMVFSYANTFTLMKEMQKVELKDLQIGDVFIVGYPDRFGHAVIVMDVAEHKNTKEKIFLIAQSYMPAQDIHLLKNTNDTQNPFWYSVPQIKEMLNTPEWDFPADALRRF